MSTKFKKFHPIYAGSNSIGSRAAQEVAGFATLPAIDLSYMMDYTAPNHDRDQPGRALKLALAKNENIPEDNILVAGSGLDIIKQLPNWLNVKEVVHIKYDFIGYQIAAKLSNLEHISLNSELGQGRFDIKAAVKKLRQCSFPLVFITSPYTNPGQVTLTIDDIETLYTANDKAIFVLDGAYRRFAKRLGRITPNLAKYAIEKKRVIYINVAAKEFGACGTRVSWLCAGESLLADLSKFVSPYPVPTISAIFLVELLKFENIIDGIQDIQLAAVQVYQKHFALRSNRFLSCGAPWVMLNCGDKAAGLVKHLAEEWEIYVQPQAHIFPDLDGWIRISATSPQEAERVCHAIGEYLGD